MTINKERAIELLGLSNMGSLRKAFVGSRGVNSKTSPLYHPNGISEQEDMEIRKLWDQMPGHTSYADALRKLAKGGL